MTNIKKITLCLGLAVVAMPQLMSAKTVGTVNASALNVRERATTAASIVGKVYNKQSVTILDCVGSGSDEWYQVDMNSGKAYAKREYITLTKADGVVEASTLNIRSYPDINKSKVIGKLKRGTAVDVLYKVNGFYKIMINGSAGFVSSDYIDCAYDAYVNKQVLQNVGTIPVWTGGGASSNTQVSSKSLREQVVATAKKYLGNPYVYGGTSLTNGTDCSGFTQGVMKIHGINLPRTSSLQSKEGTLVSRQNIQKGDLVFFGTSPSNISHCGIYIGNGEMIHASTAKTGIIISSIDRMGSTPLQVIRSVIK